VRFFMTFPVFCQRVGFLGAFLALLPCVLRADTGKLPAVIEAESRLLEDLQYLASDELQGRAAETPGLKLGAEFIAKRYKTLGLRTDLFDGQPFQEFSLNGAPDLRDPANNRLSIVQPNGEVTELKLGEQFRSLSIGNSAPFEGGIVFTGYGISADEENLKYDDFAGVDVAGKVVIVIRKEPQQNDAKSPFDGTSPSRYAVFTAKQINAAKHGVAAMIMINDAVSDESSPDIVLPVAGAGTALTKDQVPTIFVQRSIVKQWLEAAGMSLEKIEAEIDEDLKPRSAPLTGWKAIGQTDVGAKKLPSMNVVGVLPGAGELANEYVVLGAHFDHVGLGGVGSLAPGTFEVHNGADDNGSGTVALLECARRLSQLAAADPNTPRRTFVFIAFSGEELGLLGSDYYVKHPRFELEKTVAMLNMDMVGRLTNNELTVYGTGTATEFDAMVENSNRSLAFILQKLPEGMGPSDHQNFFLKSIPVLHFFTGLHDDYHRPSDDFGKINLNGIVRVTDMVTELASGIATNPAKPTFVKVRGMANPRANGPRRIRLGVRLNTDAEGVVVERAMPDSLAERAKMQAGDVVLKINEDEITSRSELDRVLQKLKSGEEITLHVRRGDEKIELKVKL
jgi:hypothetical protein